MSDKETYIFMKHTIDDVMSGINLYILNKNISNGFNSESFNSNLSFQDAYSSMESSFADLDAMFVEFLKINPKLVIKFNELLQVYHVMDTSLDYGYSLKQLKHHYQSLVNKIALDIWADLYKMNLFIELKILSIKE